MIPLLIALAVLVAVGTVMCQLYIGRPGLYGTVWIGAVAALVWLGILGVGYGAASGWRIDHRLIDHVEGGYHMSVMRDAERSYMHGSEDDPGWDIDQLTLRAGCLELRRATALVAYTDNLTDGEERLPVPEELDIYKVGVSWDPWNPFSLAQTDWPDLGEGADSIYVELADGILSHSPDALASTIDGIAGTASEAGTGEYLWRHRNARAAAAAAQSDLQHNSVLSGGADPRGLCQDRVRS